MQNVLTLYSVIPAVLEGQEKLTKGGPYRDIPPDHRNSRPPSNTHLVQHVFLPQYRSHPILDNYLASASNHILHHLRHLAHLNCAVQIRYLFTCRWDSNHCSPQICIENYLKRPMQICPLSTRLTPKHEKRCFHVPSPPHSNVEKNLGPKTWCFCP